MPRTPGKLKSVWTQAAFYSSLGLIMPTGTVVGFLIGWYLDRSLGTAPVLAILLGILGAAGSIFEVFQILKRTEGNGDGDDSSAGSGPS